MGPNISCPERGSHATWSTGGHLLPCHRRSSGWLPAVLLTSAFSLTSPSAGHAQAPDAGVPSHRVVGAHRQDMSSFALPGPRKLDAETRARLAEQRTPIRFDPSGAN